MMRRRRPTVALLVWLLLIGIGTRAFAYRPFDGTDAAVAEPGALEIELGPAGYVEVGPDNRMLVAPGVRLNYGIAERWEAVLEGAVTTGLAADSATTSLLGNGLFLKTVLREGTLQDKTGPSIATEFGFLLPEINGDQPNGTGASFTTIVSQRWQDLAIHFNTGVALTR